MNKYKKITYLWIFSIISLFLFHIIIYYTYTSKVYLDPNKKFVGDLGRTSYMLDILSERSVDNINLKKRHIKFTDYNGEQIDLLTIGDSFSNGMGFGLNRYYQDYIASLYDMNVLNISQLKGTNNYIETILLLANSNYLEKIGVKYIMIETIQRSIIDNMSNINIDISQEDKNFTNLIKNSNDIYTLKSLKENKITIINNLNFNALKYNLKYMINGYGKNNSFYREKLSKKLFSSKSESDIVFYHDDIKKLSIETKENIELVNKNLNLLATKLSKKGIKLIFMPVVDKYNLYKNYIISNKYPSSILFEYLRTLNKKYIFIDTKKILNKELDRDVKDLFYSDDTHWSYKASNAIMKEKTIYELFRNKRNNY